MASSGTDQFPAHAKVQGSSFVMRGQAARVIWRIDG